MGQICQFSHFPPIFELKCSQIFCYCTFSMPVGSKQLIEQILEKEFFFKNDIFGIFRPKNHKNCQKIIFYFEKWKFFWHTLIIWEGQHFSCFTLFDLVKKVGKNEIFLAFLGQKITKMAKKHFLF